MHKMATFTAATLMLLFLAFALGALKDQKGTNSRKSFRSRNDSQAFSREKVTFLSKSTGRRRSSGSSDAVLSLRDGEADADADAAATTASAISTDSAISPDCPVTTVSASATDAASSAVSEGSTESQCPTSPPCDECQPCPACPKTIPPGYKIYSKRGYYKMHYEKKTWVEAKNACEREGGYLAVIDREDEIFVPRNIMRKYRVIYNINIGFFYQKRRKIFLNVLGERQKYLGWAPGEPNNLSWELCGSFIRNGFNDIDCNSSQPFLCEFNV